MYSGKRWGAWRTVGRMLLAVGAALATTQAYPSTLRLLQEETLARLVSPEPRSSHGGWLVAQAAPGQAPMTPRPFSQGEVLYIRHCARCHGWEGKGNGPVGQVLVKKP